MKRDRKKVIELLQNGYALAEVAKKLNMPKTSVFSIYAKNKQEIGKIKSLTYRRINDDFFDSIDSEIKAYLLGFFLADGYIEKNYSRMGVEIQIDDKYVLELFKKHIIPDHIIHERNRVDETINRKTQINITFSSKVLVRSLMKWNIKPQKTYDIDFRFPFENMPEEMIRHFIRGFFDGDGYVGTNGGTRNNILYSFVFTSETFAKQIAKYTCLNGMEPSLRETIGKTVNWFTLRYNSNRINRFEKVKSFYDYLYKDAIYFMKRKKDKFDTYLKYRGKQLEERANRHRNA